MVLDNSIIKQNLEILLDELSVLDAKRAKLEAIVNGYHSINEIEKRVPNTKGGHDVVKEIPNHRNLSKILLEKERQLTFQDSTEKFAQRNN